MTSCLRTFSSSTAFLLTGVGTALLGATLPATLHQWQLSDSQAGLLLLASWGGSTSGAFFARGRLSHTAAAGLAISAIALFAIANHPLAALLALFLAYGLGLGITMTAISLLRSQEVSRQQTDLELNRLNLIWAAGACIAPPLAVRSLHLLTVTSLYRGAGVVFLLGAGLLLLASPSPESSDIPVAMPEKRQLKLAPLRFGMYAAASVGMESAIGSWLTTYAERSAAGVVTAVSANSAFWIGLMLSRAVHSVNASAWLHTRVARTLHILSVGVAMVVLLLIPGRLPITCAGLLCGFGLGPLYPYVLSVVLPRYRSTSVFVLAGVGASVVPWLTGVLSSAERSLRVGLTVPAAAWILLIVCARRIRGDEDAPGPASNR